MRIKPWLQFLRYLKPYIRQEVVLLLLLLVGSCCALASPYILKIIIDQVFPNRDSQLLFQVLWLLLGIYLLRIATYFASDYLYTWVSNRLLLALTSDLFDHIIRLPLSFFQERNIGDIVHRINIEVGQIQSALTGSIINFLNNFFNVVGLVVMLCILNVKLFLTISIIYPLLILCVRYFEPAIKKTIEKIRIKESAILGYFTERFTNVKLIKSAGTFEFERGTVREQIMQLGGLNNRSILLTSGSRNIALLLLALIPVLVLGLGGSQALAGTLSLGTLVAFLQYANRLHEPYKNLVHLYVELLNTSVSIERIFHFLEQPVQFPQDPAALLPPEHLKIIRFEHLDFAYGQEPVFQGLNLELEIGKHYAFVGTSGCGKSTLINLLCKFYEPVQGRIRINDTDLKEIDFAGWMKRVAIVSQESMLFNQSLGENIRYGNPEVSWEEVQQAAMLTQLWKESENIDSFLQMNVGDGGNRLSGGQRQKIALARTLLKQADILLLDEATSAIDSESETRIIDHLLHSHAFKTVILISHRFSSLRQADEIIVFDQGKILERGPATDLLARRGKFFQLFHKQLEAVA